VAALELPPGLVERTIEYLHQGRVLARLGLCLLTIVVLWGVTRAWQPPMSFRPGFTPRRNIVARTSFSKPDPQRTLEAQDKASREVRQIYEQDKEPLVQLRAGLQNQVVRVIEAKTLDDLEEGVWPEFFAKRHPGDAPPTPEQLAEHFKLFHEGLPNREAMSRFDKAVAEALAPFEQRGLLKEPPRQNEGNQKEVVVHPKGEPNWTQIVEVNDVLLGQRTADILKKRLNERFSSREVATRVFEWLRPRLPGTLSFSAEETRRASDAAKESVGEIYHTFELGDVLAPAGIPLDIEQMTLLEKEHDALVEKLTFAEKLYRSLAAMGMFVALSTLCGVYVLVYERRLLKTLRSFATMLTLVVATAGLSMLASRDNLRAEVIPVLVFGMTVAIAYHQEMALLFAAAMTLIVVMTIGQGLSEFIILTAADATAILLLGRIRSRLKLFYVGLCVGMVALLTTIGVNTLDEQPFDATLNSALRFGMWSFVACGFVMTGLLPFVEKIFGVQTELRLLELGDIAHPLLQELVRRAPGTYNHSINVASIAEAAAESIGAKGLLVRVGAYFHDIGKMLKPGYFVENQGQDANRHESLVPAMSTLIIVAHIKDGADLARQHHLPQPIIDFIQQHHGTTLVEYFYRRANEQSKADPDAAEVEERSFRYPGPKPQTKEAAVLMLADAVESASRALVEPTPSRIENLVHEISMKRLTDNQFDCCGLTLQELATVEDSLIKSLTAVYHGRVKYPSQRTA